MNKDLDDHLTIDVARGSLEEAIAGTRKGERWIDGKGRTLVYNDGEAGARYLANPGEAIIGYTGCPALSGWHRVDAPLVCPRCGGLVSVAQRWGKYLCLCGHCGLSDGRSGPYPYPTEAEARAAWLKIGARSLPWRRNTELPRVMRRCLVLEKSGEIAAVYSPFGDYVAWMYASDLPLPSWAKEGKP